MQGISIRAATRAATGLVQSGLSGHMNFYPRRHTGGDHRSRRSPSHPADFYPRRHTGGDFAQVPVPAPAQKFLPAPPHGRRQQNYTNIHPKFVSSAQFTNSHILIMYNFCNNFQKSFSETLSFSFSLGANRSGMQCLLMVRTAFLLSPLFPLVTNMNFLVFISLSIRFSIFLNISLRNFHQKIKGSSTLTPLSTPTCSTFVSCLLPK